MNKKNMSPGKRLLLCLVELALLVSIIFIGMTIVRFNFFQPLLVQGYSMMDTLHNNDTIYIQTSSYKLEYNDIICIYRPGDFSNYDPTTNPALNKHSFSQFLRSIPFLGKELAGDDLTNADWKLLVKRVVGLPGDTIALRSELVEGDHRIFLYRNGEKVENDFVMYDKNYHDSTMTVDSDVFPVAEFTLADDELFILGDNRGNSVDSEENGAFKVDWVYGKMVAYTKNGKLTFKSA